MTQQSDIHTLAVKVGEISGRPRGLNMLPYMPVPNVVRVRRGYAKLAPEFGTPQRRGPDRDHIRFAQLGRFVRNRGGAL
jgi:hypothetical protein